MSAKLKLLQFPVGEHFDVVGELRRLADEIEAGEYGAVRIAALVTFGDKLDIFSVGTDTNAGECTLLFNAAALRLARSIEGHGA